MKIYIIKMKKKNKIQKVRLIIFLKKGILFKIVENYVNWKNYIK